MRLFFAAERVQLIGDYLVKVFMLYLPPVGRLWPSGDDGDGDADEGADDAQADGGVLMVQIRDRNENISVGISASPKLLLKN